MSPRRRSIGCRIADAVELIGQLPGTEQREGPRWSSARVGAHTFGYLWPDTNTVGLKQPLHEQLALIAERPEVFEEQFTAGSFGWVVIHLELIERRELAELIFEAWRLTAGAELVAERGDALPR